MATIKCEASGCKNTDRSGKIFFSAINAGDGGAVTMGTRAGNALGGKEGFSRGDRL